MSWLYAAVSSDGNEWANSGYARFAEVCPEGVGVHRHLRAVLAVPTLQMCRDACRGQL
jgi:hypothetical protein